MQREVREGREREDFLNNSPPVKDHTINLLEQSQEEFFYWSQTRACNYCRIFKQSSEKLEDNNFKI